jgi:hypothetical protein
MTEDSPYFTKKTSASISIGVATVVDERPTGRLRFVTRAKYHAFDDTVRGQRILQQEWLIFAHGAHGAGGLVYEWRDVPVEEET